LSRAVGLAAAALSIGGGQLETPNSAQLVMSEVVCLSKDCSQTIRLFACALCLGLSRGPEVGHHCMTSLLSIAPKRFNFTPGLDSRLGVVHTFPSPMTLRPTSTKINWSHFETQMAGFELRISLLLPHFFVRLVKPERQQRSNASFCSFRLTKFLVTPNQAPPPWSRSRLCS
jgi:hypothetical protein